MGIDTVASKTGSCLVRKVVAQPDVKFDVIDTARKTISRSPSYGLLGSLLNDGSYRCTFCFRICGSASFALDVVTDEMTWASSRG